MSEQVSGTAVSDVGGRLREAPVESLIAPPEAPATTLSAEQVHRRLGIVATLPGLAEAVAAVQDRGIVSAFQSH